MGAVWADTTAIDTLYVHERVVQHGGRDVYDWMTLLLLAANAVLFLYTAIISRKAAQANERAAEATRDSVKATRDSAEATVKAAQISVVAELLGEFSKPGMHTANNQVLEVRRDNGFKQFGVLLNYPKQELIGGKPIGELVEMVLSPFWNTFLLYRGGIITLEQVKAVVTETRTRLFLYLAEPREKETEPELLAFYRGLYRGIQRIPEKNS